MKGCLNWVNWINWILIKINGMSFNNYDNKCN